MNVLLIAIDTLRADHLSCYGYRRPTSPTLDRLAKEGVRCSNFMAAGIPTHPSFTTLISGQHPIRHGVVAHGGKAELHHATPTLAQLFLEKDYCTAAFDNLPHHKTQFGRGYEMIVDSSRRRACGLMVSCDEINTRLLPFLRTANKDEPFFAFVHYWDPHTPYWAPPRYRSLFYNGNPCDPALNGMEPLYTHPLGKQWCDTWFKRVLKDSGRDPNALITDPAFVEALYDQEIRYTDDGVADVLDTLDETGLAEDTLVLILADHGECMTEHGIYFDHHGLYDENLHVPLIVRHPQLIKKGRSVDALIQHQDILPTLCEAAGLRVPENIDGKSAWGLMTGQREKEVLAEVLVSEECTWQKKWSLRDNRWHFILARQEDWYRNPLRELYDLSNDPGLTRNVAAEQPGMVRELEHKLEAWITERCKAAGRTGDPLLETDVSLIDSKLRKVKSKK